MTVHNHAVVWVDHRVAKVFYLGLETVDERAIHADLARPHLHHRANTIGSGKVEDDPTFFRGSMRRWNIARRSLSWVPETRRRCC